MGDFSKLRADIQAQIKPNGEGAITGQVMQDTMLSMVDATEAKLTELSAEMGAVSAGKNVVNYYEHGYISYDKTIFRGGNGVYKFVMVSVHEGEEYAYYSKYAENLFIAFCADKDTWFSRQQVVEGWQNFTIPSGCNFLGVSIQFNAAQEDAVAHAFLYNAKVTEQAFKSISDLSDKVEEEMQSMEGISERVEQLYQLTITEGGKNLYDGSVVNGYIDSSNGELSATSSSLYKSTGVIPLEGGKYYCVSGELSTKVRSAVAYDNSNNPLKLIVDGREYYSYGTSAKSFYQFALPTNAVSLQFTIDFNEGKTSHLIMLEVVGDSYDASFVPSPYEPYSGGERLVIPEESLSKNLKEKINQGGKAINILMLGNSFTQDSMCYVPFIMQNIAPSIKLNLAIGYIGGCSLAQHCANLTGENQVLNGITYSPTTYTYQLYQSGKVAWESVGSRTIDEMLSEKKWDIITLQQNGSDAAKSWDVCYAPFIYKIHRKMAEKCGNATKFGWLLVHGAYSDTTEGLQSNWQGSAENTQKIQDLTPNQLIFPYGTAVQNLRTTPLANLGDGGNLMGDTAHLHEGIGCLAAAYANTLTILDALGLGEVSIIGEDTRPTKTWCTEHGVLSPNYGATTNDVVGITEDNCYLAQVAAIQAVKKPYEISDLANFVV